MLPHPPAPGAYSTDQERAERDAENKVTDYATDYLLSHVVPVKDGRRKPHSEVRILVTLAHIFACHETDWPSADVVRARLEKEEEDKEAAAQAFVSPGKVQ